RRRARRDLRRRRREDGVGRFPEAEVRTVTRLVAPPRRGGAVECRRTPMSAAVTEHVARSARHVTFYLAAGPQDGPLIVFCHGWPELSISWRHQLACFGALG